MASLPTAPSGVAGQLAETQRDERVMHRAVGGRTVARVHGGGRWRAKTGLRDIDHAAASSRRRLRPRRLAGG